MFKWLKLKVVAGHVWRCLAMFDDSVSWLFPTKILSIKLCKALWCLLRLFPTTFLQAKEVARLPDYNTNAPVMHFHVIFDLSQLFEAPWYTTKITSGQFENISSTQFSNLRISLHDYQQLFISAAGAKANRITSLHTIVCSTTTITPARLTVMCSYCFIWWVCAGRNKKYNTGIPV